jgi:uncharacterized protein YeaO (DUF488 family)
MRRWPRGVRKERVDLWLKDAAPSSQLLDRLQHGEMSWVDFESHYRREMLDDRPHVLLQLQQLEAAHGTLTLLCHERIPPAAHCHRQILAQLLADATGT